MARADHALNRLAYVVPAASREGGARLDDLARELEVTPERILADLSALSDRDFYHPGGWFSDVVIMTSGDRLEVDRAGPFERPGKLNATEALCLSIGLRGLGAGSFATSEERDALIARADALVVHGVKDGTDHTGFEIADDDEAGDGLDAVLLQCTRERTVCRIRYLTRGEREDRRTVVDREIEPHVMARSEGYWYAIGWCRLREGVRAFRLDRVVGAEETGESFTDQDGFDAEAWVAERRVYHGREETPVRVRYGATVARWVREDAANRGAVVEESDDGDIIVEHQVADWDWIVRRVLSYGAEAEVVSPPEVRQRVAAVLGGMGD